MKGKEPGDLYVHFQVRSPTTRSDEIGALIDKLGELSPDDPRSLIKF